MKMFSLSVLIVGILGSTGVYAACTPSSLSAWSGQTASGGTLTVATPGLDASECRLASSLLSGSSAFSSATVRDDTPAAEQRYRAQFLINADALVQQSAFASAKVFSLSGTTAHLGSQQLLRFSVSGGANRVLNIITVNENGVSGVSSSSVPLSSGTNRVELDYTVGTAGSLKVWVNGPIASAPSVVLTALNNLPWGGVERATLGLSNPNNLFVAAHASQPVSFDAFDSRRTTFIGG